MCHEPVDLDRQFELREDTCRIDHSQSDCGDFARAQQAPIPRNRAGSLADKKTFSRLFHSFGGLDASASQQGVVPPGSLRE